jgi:hypothetical protein
MTHPLLADFTRLSRIIKEETWPRAAKKGALPQSQAKEQIIYISISATLSRLE